jgi:hypothetical protein
MTVTLSAEPAKELILQGAAPDDLRVTGVLDLSQISTPLHLPNNLQVRRLNLRGSMGLKDLPNGLQCYELDASFTAIRTVPDDIVVESRLVLEGCALLTSLPAGLRVGSLILRDALALQALPEDLHVNFLDLTGCVQLTDWPKRINLGRGRLIARGCKNLRRIPDNLGDLAQVDLSGCTALRELPALRVSSWLDLADTEIFSLPADAQIAQLRWRGVPVDERILFQPETITGAEVLAESNAERRRVMLQRMGYEKFLEQVQAKTLNTDSDPGGERRLLYVPLENDEPLVCLAVYCPSTKRQYLLRVPPTMRTCHQAAAWIAGFDDPNQYKPVMES